MEPWNTDFSIASKLTPFAVKILQIPTPPFDQELRVGPLMDERTGRNIANVSETERRVGISFRSERAGSFSLPNLSLSRSPLCFRHTSK